MSDKESARERKPCEVYASLTLAAASPLLGAKGLGVFTVETRVGDEFAVIAPGEEQARNAVGRWLVQECRVSRKTTLDLIKAMLPPKIEETPTE